MVYSHARPEYIIPKMNANGEMATAKALDCFNPWEFIEKWGE